MTYPEYGRRNWSTGFNNILMQSILCSILRDDLDKNREVIKEETHEYIKQSCKFESSLAGNHSKNRLGRLDSIQASQ